jgi:pre-rRNA-processing protein IPI1
VRSQCLKFLSELPPNDVASKAEELTLYARVAITHLSLKIQLTGLEVLEWLLNVADSNVVSAPGGWLRTINVLLVALEWKGLSGTKSDSGWRKSTVNSRTTGTDDDGKLKMRLLNVFALLLEKGLQDTYERDRLERYKEAQQRFPYFLYPACAIPKKSNPYGYLNLFGPPRDEESQQYLDSRERAEAYVKYVSEDVQVGVEKMKREGGGVGRAAMNLERVIKSAHLDHPTIYNKPARTTWLDLV